MLYSTSTSMQISHTQMVNFWKYNCIWTDPFNSYYGINEPTSGNIEGAVVLYANIAYKVPPTTTLVLALIMR
jgi:hypothetical protein